MKQVKGLEIPSGSCVCCCCSALDSESASSSIRFSKACLKNVFSVLLIFIYLLLMAVAVFLVYQTITDFREKLKHPVMSVSYKEVDRYDAPGSTCPGTGIGSQAATSKYPPSLHCIPGTVPGTMGRAGESETVWVWVAPPHELPLVPSQRVVCRGARRTKPGVLAAGLEWAPKTSFTAGFELGFGRWKSFSGRRVHRSRDELRETGLLWGDESSLAGAGPQ